uniref:Olfactory receptor n=1 Tax=Leptobrachium leishanense TaxID=445787 RepID=A0A8C5MXM5_9ANUR
MEENNQTAITEFILIGLSQNPMAKNLLFVLFLFVYVVTVCGNVTLICTVIANAHMHTPMYYFLCHLSFIDLFFSSSTVPKMLLDMICINGGRISYMGCVLQMNISLFLGETECILLAVMAYDRYIAICHPLHYMVIMSWRRCKYTMVIVWLGCFGCTVVPTISGQRPICKGNVINHFVCEVIALLKLVCGDTSYEEAKITLGSFFTLLVPFAFIITTYLCIIRSMLKIHSVDGRMKTFTTCTSHITVVVLFYGTSMTLYLGQAKHLTNKHKVITVFYAVVTPMLNPLIYSLRNNEVKGAFMKTICANKKIKFSTSKSHY